MRRHCEVSSPVDVEISNRVRVSGGAYSQLRNESKEADRLRMRHSKETNERRELKKAIVSWKEGGFF